MDGKVRETAAGARAVGCGAGLEMRAAPAHPARGPGSVAGEAPGCGAVFVSGLLASLSSLTASAACCDNSTRTHARAHTPLFKAQRRSLALRAVSCGIVVRTKFDGERCCEACAQRAAAGDADGGPGG